MKRFLNILSKKITLGFILSTIVSVLFAILVRFILENYMGIIPIKGGLKEVDLSYAGLIILFRFIFTVVLEYFMEDKFRLPVGDMFKSPDITSFRMDKSGSDVLNNKGELNDGKSGAANSILNIDEYEKLKYEMKSRLDTAKSMIDKLKELKQQSDVKYFLDKNVGLSIDVPGTMGEAEYTSISKRVGIIDRIINTKFSEYNQFQVRDLMSNNSRVSDDLSKLHDSYKKEYNNLFEK